VKPKGSLETSNKIPLISILGHARKDAKIGLPDQQVYKVMGAEGSKLGYVLRMVHLGTLIEHSVRL